MDENTIRRVQPHNEKAEQGIVGTMLVNRDAISDLVDMLTGEDFYNKQYGILFDNMVELYSEGASVDPITLVERLRMKDIPEEVAKKAKLMVVSYPNNPTTAMAPAQFYQDLVAFAKKYDIIVLHDNAYSELVFDGKTCGSFLSYPGAKEIGVEFNSLSKTYGLAGARIGFCLGNKEVVKHLKMLKSNMDYGMFLPIQAAAVAALTGDQDCVYDTMKAYEARRDILCDGLRSIGWEMDRPVATMFVWAPIPKQYESSEAFVMDLVEKTGVMVTPGSAFGPSGEGFVRMALVQDREALERAIHAVDESGIFSKENA